MTIYYCCEWGDLNTEEKRRLKIQLAQMKAGNIIINLVDEVPF